ncbi:MAG TPA: type IV pilus assembly protein PilM [Candidatus Saccharimonadales bacterium]|nr:type IV pilus assembly protein PilM [Candidatus Saccharimonadales bacterium]
MDNTYFFKDKPLFGLDIGFSSLKVMQLDTSSKKTVIKGYGTTNFDPTAIVDGLIKEPDLLAQATYSLFEGNIVGQIDTRRVAIAIPASRTFTRTVHLPKLKTKDVGEAIQLEAEQYIPVPLEELYMSHSVIEQNSDETVVLAVAVPKRIVDSYMDLAKILGLEVVAIETTIASSGRLFNQAERNDSPTVLVDFGSVTTDITIYDNTLVVTGSVAGGGDSFTNIISRSLSVNRAEAMVIKTRYGLGVSKKQGDIVDGLTPFLEQLVKEIKRMIRYYEDRNNDKKRKIAQIVTMGGGANLPGLTEFMTSNLRIPVRMCDTWQNISFNELPRPEQAEKSMFVTVAGLALLKPKDIFS